jgi:single-strand DNA-binding protein
VTVFNEHLVSKAENFLHKGSKVYLEGQLENRKWKDRENNDRYSTEIVLHPYRGELTMLDPAPNRPQPVVTKTVAPTNEAA